MWAKAVEEFVASEDVVEALKETYALTRDFQMFRRIMVGLLALDRVCASLTSQTDSPGIGAQSYVSISYSREVGLGHKDPAVPTPASRIGQ